MPTRYLTACELKNKVAAAIVLAAALVAFAPAALAQDAPSQPPAAEHAAQPAEAGHDQAAAEGEHAGEHSIGEMILGLGWPLANFVVFAGVLYYFLNQPIRDYLNTRGAAIRKDLVEAAAIRTTATAQLAEIEQKLQALPGVVTRLRERGAEEIAAEEQRIAAAAEAERERLLEQTRREIDLQVRLAKKAILEHAADLSVQLATERLKQDMTPADQARIVDRYLQQVKES